MFREPIEFERGAALCAARSLLLVRALGSACTCLTHTIPLACVLVTKVSIERAMVRGGAPTRIPSLAHPSVRLLRSHSLAHLIIPPLNRALLHSFTRSPTLPLCHRLR